MIGICWLCPFEPQEFTADNTVTVNVPAAAKAVLRLKGGTIWREQPTGNVIVQPGQHLRLTQREAS